MTGLAVWELVKKFWWVLPLVLFLWWGYNLIYDRGAHSRDPEVKNLTDAYQSWKTYGQAEAKVVKDERAAHATALAGLQGDQAAIVADMKSRLDAAEKRATKVHVLTKEVKVYVSPTADSHFPVPYGFLLLHNDSLGAEGAATAPAIPAGGRPDADAASPVALSTVGQVIRDNYAECVARGEVIQAWQDWYPKMRSAWDKAVQVQLAAPSAMPSAPPELTK